MSTELTIQPAGDPWPWPSLPSQPWTPTIYPAPPYMPSFIHQHVTYGTKPSERIHAAMDEIVQAAREVQGTTDALDLGVEGEDIKKALIKMFKKHLDAID